MQVIPTKYACGRPVHRSNQVSLWPKPNSIRLDRVAEFQTHIPPNIRVRSDVSGNRLTASKLSICQVKHHMPPWSQLDPSLPQVIIFIEVLTMEIRSVKNLTELVNYQIIYLFINASHTY